MSLLLLTALLSFLLGILVGVVLDDAAALYRRSRREDTHDDHP
jgi:hypothetical protein